MDESVNEEEALATKVGGILSDAMQESMRPISNVANGGCGLTPFW